MENPVRRNAEFVLAHARDVAIDRYAVAELAAKWVSQGVSPPEWPRSLHFWDRDEARVLAYLFILDSLNFCFWPRRGKRWRVRYGGKSWSGYFALSLSLKRFFEAHPEQASTTGFAEMPFREFRGIFRGSGELQLMEKRWEIARSVSRALERHGGTRSFVRRARGSAPKLVSQIVRHLPFFKDEVRYKGNTVRFWKRAQILAGDIYGAFRGEGPGRLSNMGYLTAFPDYALPRILWNCGALAYAPRLFAKISDRSPIASGSEEEVEIRGATVMAVELLREALQRKGKRMRSFEIDWILWNATRGISRGMPHHRTRGIFY